MGPRPGSGRRLGNGGVLESLGRLGSGGVLGSWGVLGIGVVSSVRQAAPCEANNGMSGRAADTVAVLPCSTGSGVWEPGVRRAAAMDWAAAVGSTFGSDTIAVQGLMMDAAAEGPGLYSAVKLCTGDTGAADSCAGCDGVNVGN